jgi:GR25 family glycosyltransferase involved in LPS biosynthesis
MAPAPVCVILEDDAILVDRFADKVAALLKELPRDFHFCSLGYSRPKSAPIVPFTSKLGIPSMLWYLTGYILSEAGARYLLDSLPVVGPVDSWVGLQMTNNWDNVFGMKLGVGVHSKPNSELPAHRDLCKILKFRAFCALQPLCTQKVRVEAAATAGTVVAASTGRHWRQRDTDIEYSGYSSKTTAVSNTNR